MSRTDRICLKTQLWFLAAGIIVALIDHGSARIFSGWFFGAAGGIGLKPMIERLA
jgi:hypothetical protein